MYKEKFNYYLELINNEIENIKLDYSCYQKKLFDSVNYSFNAPGKRLRPVILLAACEMTGGNINEALPFAIGLEMIHNSSLIHDDLPAMDNDDLRRDRPTNHIVYGDATAILAGDVLLVRPFEIMAQNSHNENHIKAMRIIANAAGAEGMMGGQQIDLDSENKQVDKDTIIRLNQLKTGALFKAAVTAGAAIAGCDDSEIEQLSKYGDNLGLAFQLVDDILDNDEKAETGKTKGSDISSNKSTYLSLYGETKCRELIRKSTLDAVSVIKCYGDKANFLSELVLNLENRIK